MGSSEGGKAQESRDCGGRVWPQGHQLTAPPVAQLIQVSDLLRLYFGHLLL